MRKIRPEEYQERLDRIADLFTDMVIHADELSTMRCPYKDRFDQCTAQFGCRNKRKPLEPGQLPVCDSDDKLDYRKAWQTV